MAARRMRFFLLVLDILIQRVIITPDCPFIAAMISLTTIHAIRALAHLAEADGDEYVGARSLAADIDAPPNYLSKLLKSLSYTGIVTSRKGKGGGFRLARPADQIRLLDVVEPIEHLSLQPECVFRRERCSADSPCPLHTRWAAVRGQLMEFLKDTTIADVVADGDSAIPSRDP